MATARPLTKRPPTHRSASKSTPKTPRSTRSVSVQCPLSAPKVPLPAGQPREWYETHNRQLKAMRLAIALLDSGVYTPARATDQRISGTAARIGVRPPSRATCRLVRSFLPTLGACAR
ncbi:hypothetical protein [Streptomyces phytohabitans]|uniref:hypothetical protein n=1 Tax=Streptomyces phytohabitans TaxID=1150371 RepID=UPI00345C3D89